MKKIWKYLSDEYDRKFLMRLLVKDLILTGVMMSKVGRDLGTASFYDFLALRGSHAAEKAFAGFVLYNSVAYPVFFILWMEMKKRLFDGENDYLSIRSFAGVIVGIAFYFMAGVLCPVFILVYGLYKLVKSIVVDGNWRSRICTILTLKSSRRRNRRALRKAAKRWFPQGSAPGSSDETQCYGNLVLIKGGKNK